MQPSQYDIQREVEALRDLRRRSTAPGALALDPDLPNPSSPTSPTSAYWSGAAQGQAADPDPSRRSSESSSRDVHGSGSEPPQQVVSDDPFHLFWVPADVHPEIAPAEFRAFLKEHARNPPPPGDSSSPSSSLGRSVSSGLGRRTSMLRRQYKPQENDGVEEDEEIVPLRRNRSMYNSGPQLTISDLQKLEQLAEEASKSDDPSKFRSILRRSLSLNVPPTALNSQDELDLGDEADSPIIVPPPGQILRRAARTKIRKPGLPGDGGGHRFGSTRRRGTAPPSVEGDGRLSGEFSSDHSDSSVPEVPPLPKIRPFSGESAESQRPQSFGEESIFDAYVHGDESDDGHVPVVVESPAQSVEDLSLQAEPDATSEPTAPVPTPPVTVSAPVPIPAVSGASSAPGMAQPPSIYHPQPQYMLSPQPQSSPDRQATSRSPSPSESSVSTSELVSRSPPSFLSSPPPTSSTSKKDKDKKGLFGKWGSDKSTKKSKKEKEREKDKEKEREKEERTSEKETQSGFFGSLFGKKSKEPDSSQPSTKEQSPSSKNSKGFQPVAPGNMQGLPPGVNNYSRYPIHVERAIYRLSHIKLANPRRPLYEQVLISNLMFWYLGVINKAQTQGNPNAAAGGGAQMGANGQMGGQGPQGGQGPKQEQGDDEGMEKERRDQEDSEREQRERAEQEKVEKEQREAQNQNRKQSPPPRQRGPLTKPPPAGAGGRHAEMPVKGPQYEMQHRVMEQEYGYGGGYNNPPSPRRTGGMSPPPSHQQYQQQQAQYGPSQTYSSGSLPQLSPITSDTQLSELYYYAQKQTSPPANQQQHNLPPGAMPPVDQSAWMSQSTPSSPPLMSPPTSPPRRSRSPNSDMPVHNNNQNNRPTRSQSAQAIMTTPQANGKLRKGYSAHAAVPDRRPTSAEPPPPMPNGYGGGEEEDVPLAVYQQQQRRR